MTDEELLELVVRAGRESARRGFGLHRQLLGALYRALRHGLFRTSGSAGPLVEELLVEWSRALAVPPFDTAADDGTGNLGVCLRCKAGKGGRREMRVELQWRSGALLKCPSCGHTALRR